jgi:hypothetical protein
MKGSESRRARLQLRSLAARAAVPGPATAARRPKPPQAHKRYFAARNRPLAAAAQELHAGARCRARGPQPCPPQRPGSPLLRDALRRLLQHEARDDANLIGPELVENDLARGRREGAFGRLVGGRRFGSTQPAACSIRDSYFGGRRSFHAVCCFGLDARCHWPVIAAAGTVRVRPETAAPACSSKRPQARTLWGRARRPPQNRKCPCGMSSGD